MFNKDHEMVLKDKTKKEIEMKQKEVQDATGHNCMLNSLYLWECILANWLIYCQEFSLVSRAWS